MDTQTLSFSLATQSATMLIMLLPEFTEIRNSPPTPYLANRVRTSEAVGAGISLGLGIMAAGLSKSWEPLGYTFLTVSSIIVATELLLHNQGGVET